MEKKISKHALRAFYLLRWTLAQALVFPLRVVSAVLYAIPTTTTRRGSASVDKVIGIFLDVVLIAYTFPAALTAVFTAQTSGWTSAAQSLWPVIGLIAEVAALVVLIYSAL